MSGISITAQLSSEAAQARLSDILGRLSDLSPFFKNVGEELVKSTKARFQSQTDPEGTPWVPLSPAYARAKLKGRKGVNAGRILSLDGILGDNITAQPTATEVRIGSAAVYAAIHQLGGTISKAAGTRQSDGRRFAKAGDRTVGIGAHSITIPARPYLGISDEDEAEIFSLATRYLVP